MSAYLILLSLLLTIQVSSPQIASTNDATHASTIGYWDEGMAEVARYTVMQNRYRYIHPGELTMIFVKEDFLTDKQVKNERYISDKSTPVLKNIRLKKFNTGVYDYTMSTNVFTPIDQASFPGSLKVQHSSTEWCGTTYTQLNKNKNGYRANLHSYFENEGDQTIDISETLLEDELFNLIRFHPDLIPDGPVSIIPGMNYLRLTHSPVKASQATIKKSKAAPMVDLEDIYQLVINFQDLDRTLTIYYQNVSPYKIVGWDDTYASIADGKKRKTTVRLENLDRLAYWNHNKPDDVDKRKALGFSN